MAIVFGVQNTSGDFLLAALIFIDEIASDFIEIVRR